MPHLLNHCSTITIPCRLTLYSTPSFCPIAGRRRFSVALRRPPPPQVISTTACGGGVSVKNRAVICMASPRRVKMVAKQIRREIGEMLLTDNVLQHAVMPERALGADLYLSSLTTITDVEISNDLQIAKVYVSVFGDERGKEVAFAGLKSKAKYVRSQLGKRMRLRVTPELRFLKDDSMERGSRVLAILDKIEEENKKKARAKRDRESGKAANRNNDDVDSEGDEDEDDVDDEDDYDDDDDGDDDDDDDDGDDDDDDEGIIYVK